MWRCDRTLLLLSPVECGAEEERSRIPQAQRVTHWTHCRSAARLWPLQSHVLACSWQDVKQAQLAHELLRSQIPADVLPTAALVYSGKVSFSVVKALYDQVSKAVPPLALLSAYLHAAP